MNMMMSNNRKRKRSNRVLYHGEESSGIYQPNLGRNSDPPLYKAVVATG